MKIVGETIKSTTERKMSHGKQTLVIKRKKIKIKDLMHLEKDDKCNLLIIL